MGVKGRGAEENKGWRRSNAYGQGGRADRVGVGWIRVGMQGKKMSVSEARENTLQAVLSKQIRRTRTALAHIHVCTGEFHLRQAVHCLRYTPPRESHLFSFHSVSPPSLPLAPPRQCRLALSLSLPATGTDCRRRRYPARRSRAASTVTDQTRCSGDARFRRIVPGRSRASGQWRLAEAAAGPAC